MVSVRQVQGQPGNCRPLFTGHPRLRPGAHPTQQQRHQRRGRRSRTPRTRGSRDRRPARVSSWGSHARCRRSVRPAHQPHATVGARWGRRSRPGAATPRHRTSTTPRPAHQPGRGSPSAVFRHPARTHRCQREVPPAHQQPATQPKRAAATASPVGATLGRDPAADSRRSLLHPQRSEELPVVPSFRTRIAARPGLAEHDPLNVVTVVAAVDRQMNGLRDGFG